MVYKIARTALLLCPYLHSKHFPRSTHVRICWFNFLGHLFAIFKKYTSGMWSRKVFLGVLTAFIHSSCAILAVCDEWTLAVRKIFCRSSKTQVVDCTRILYQDSRLPSCDTYQAVYNISLPDWTIAQWSNGTSYNLVRRKNCVMESQL